jgi:hypothetical protein
MNIEVARSFLAWCFALNYLVLLLWAGLFIVWRDFYKKLWFLVIRREIANFDALNMAGIIFYKIQVILFILIPWIALTIIR